MAAGSVRSALLALCNETAQATQAKFEGLLVAYKRTVLSWSQVKLATFSQNSTNQWASFKR